MMMLFLITYRPLNTARSDEAFRDVVSTHFRALRWLLTCLLDIISLLAVHSRRASARERSHARSRTFARAIGSTRARFGARARAHYSLCVRVVAETLVLFVVVFA